MNLRPVTLKEANSFVSEVHRHHGQSRGHKFSIGAEVGGELVGVAICGRPVARMLDDGFTAEVTRVATDGSPNACSMLYGAAARAAKAMGYRKIITYTLAEEPGVSLRASGWTPVATSGGGSWSRGGREREDKHPLGEKIRWEKNL